MKYEEWLRRIIVVVADEHKMTKEEKGHVWGNVRKKMIELMNRRKT